MVVKVPKKKVVKVAEDTKSKKEHVNVVFIGHVGKQNILFFNLESFPINFIIPNDDLLNKIFHFPLHFE